VCTDQLQDAVELAFLKYMVGTSDIDHQNGRGQAQCGLTIFNAGFSALRCRDYVNDLVD